MDTTERITGTITGGMHRAKNFVSLPWVKEQCQEKLGINPYPGTLNIRVDWPVAHLLKTRAREKGAELNPGSDRSCGAYCLKINLCGLNGAIIFPGVSTQEEGVLEIVGPLNFREFCGFRDGDEVTLHLL